MCGVQSELRTNRVCTCVDNVNTSYYRFKPCFLFLFFFNLDVIYSAILVIIDCN